MVILALLAGLASPAGAQSAKAKADSDLQQLLWENPRNRHFAEDLSDPANRPQPPFRFVEEDLGGTNPKIKITDARQKHWTVKWAAENHGEIFASRLVSAMGYFVRPTVYVREGKIEGAHDLGRAKAHVKEDGSFSNAAFRLVSEQLPYVEGHNWAWSDNPFLATPEGRRYLGGLKILIMLTSNWDPKDAREVREGEYPNTAIYRRTGPGQVAAFLYAVDDWGASMGRWGNLVTREKWDCAGYRAQTPEFVKGVQDGYVTWGYTGKNAKEITEGISVDDVRWLMQYLGKITDRQLAAGLRSSGAEDADARCFQRALRARISQLQNLVRQSQKTNGLKVTQKR